MGASPRTVLAYLSDVGQYLAFLSGAGVRFEAAEYRDVRAFLARAAELGAADALAFLRDVDAINLGRRTGMVNLTCEALGGTVAGRSVCVLGAAFKPGSDDVRDSPALDVAQMLHGMGAEVTVHDPAAISNARKGCVMPTRRSVRRPARRLCCC